MKTAHITGSLIIIVIWALLAVPAQAFKKGTIELGIDGSFSVIHPVGTPNNITTLLIPSEPRIGIFVLEFLELELNLAFAVINPSGGSQTAGSLQFGPAIHMKNSTRRRSAYLKPFVAGTTQKVRPEFGRTVEVMRQGGIGVSGGFKLVSRNRLASRVELFVMRMFASKSFLATNTFGVKFGFSFFTK